MNELDVVIAVISMTSTFLFTIGGILKKYA